jgi:hypothetical protein
MRRKWRPSNLPTARTQAQASSATPGQRARSVQAVAARSARAEREDWIITSSARFSEVM